MSALSYRLEYRAYRRIFQQVLRTTRGPWSAREGVVVRLSDSRGRVGFGESAPVRGFTEETVAQDLEWLRATGGRLDGAALASLPADMLCLRWALSCAEAMMDNFFGLPGANAPLPVAALLPAGSSARDVLAERAAEGYRVFKWKIGTAPVADEQGWFEQLLHALPKGGKLRLDANGEMGVLGFADWTARLRALPRALEAVEFIEQPFAAVRTEAELAAQSKLAAASSVPVALDESATGLEALRRARALRWPGPLVVKPSLAGVVQDFVRWRSRSRPDLVYSSAFETSIGLQAALWLAATDPSAGKRALGFGTLHAFADDGLQLPVHAPGPGIAYTQLPASAFEEVWNRLTPVS